MKAITGTVVVATPVNGLWSRVDVPPLAVLHALYLANTRTDTTLRVRFKVNGVPAEQPLRQGDTFSVSPDSALDIPNVYFVQRLDTPTVLEFQADQKGLEVTFIYFESAKPPPITA